MDGERKLPVLSFQDAVIWLAVILHIFLVILIDTWLGRLQSVSLVGLCFILFAWLCFCLRVAQPPKQGKNLFVECKEPPVVVVIGGGIGGASASYFLRQILGDESTIHVLEKDESSATGRVQTVKCFGSEYECGATLIHKENKYMKGFVKGFGMKQRKLTFSMPFAIFNGSSMVFNCSNFKLLTKLRMFLRYGFSLTKMSKMINANIKKLSKVYSLQDDGVAFHSVHEMFGAIGGQDFVALTQISAREHFLSKGWSRYVVDELVGGCCRINYCQSPSRINAFTALVSLAGMQSGSLFQVVGGNHHVVQNVTSDSASEMSYGAVTSVTRIETNGKITYEVVYGSDKKIIADFVIVAHPLELSKIQFHNFPKPIVTDSMKSRKFHNVYAHLIQGKLNPQIVRTALQAGSAIPMMILTADGFESKDFGFNSLGLQSEVSKKTDEVVNQLSHVDVTRENCVWKVFAPSELPVAKLSKLVEMSSKEVVVKHWQAYPAYSTPEPLESFVLDTGMFYVNAIEQTASALEMSAIAGRNAALLVRKQIIARNQAPRGNREASDY